LSQAHEKQQMTKIEYEEFTTLVANLSTRIESILKQFKMYFALTNMKGNTRVRIFKSLINLYQFLILEIGNTGQDYITRLRQIIKEALLDDYNSLVDEVDDVNVAGLDQIVRTLKKEFEANIYATSRFFPKSLKYDVLALQVYYQRISEDFNQVRNFIRINNV
jgi:hypothetical protein